VLPESTVARSSAAAAAPRVLRKGPRGGGRDRDAIIEHVSQTEVLHARMLGIKERPLLPGDIAAVTRLRARILAEIEAQRHRPSQRRPAPLAPPCLVRGPPHCLARP
jgi:hypothetical protein